MSARQIIEALPSGVKLAQQYGPKVMPFKQLPVGAKMALVWYMAVDGEAWELPEELQGASGLGAAGKKLAAKILARMAYFDKAYGTVRFGYVEIPSDVLNAAILDAHKENWHLLAVPRKIPKEGTGKAGPWLYTGSLSITTWPCILDSDTGDILQDGWHRYGRYLDAGLPQIPCVFYA